MTEIIALYAKFSTAVASGSLASPSTSAPAAPSSVPPFATDGAVVVTPTTAQLPAIGCYVEVRALWGRTRRAYVTGHRGSDTMKLGSITGVDGSKTAHKHISYLVKVVRSGDGPTVQSTLPPEPQEAPSVAKAPPTTAEIVAAVIAALNQ